MEDHELTMKSYAAQQTLLVLDFDDTLNRGHLHNELSTLVEEFVACWGQNNPGARNVEQFTRSVMRRTLFGKPDAAWVKAFYGAASAVCADLSGAEDTQAIIDRVYDSLGFNNNSLMILRGNGRHTFQREAKVEAKLQAPVGKQPLWDPRYQPMLDAYLAARGPNTQDNSVSTKLQHFKAQHPGMSYAVASHGCFPVVRYLVSKMVGEDILVVTGNHVDFPNKAHSHIRCIIDEFNKQGRTIHRAGLLDDSARNIDAVRSVQQQGGLQGSTGNTVSLIAKPYYRSRDFDRFTQEILESPLLSYISVNSADSLAPNYTFTARSQHFPILKGFVEAFYAHSPQRLQAVQYGKHSVTLIDAPKHRGLITALLATMPEVVTYLRAPASPVVSQQYNPVIATAMKAPKLVELDGVFIDKSDIPQQVFAYLFSTYGTFKVLPWAVTIESGKTACFLAKEQVLPKQLHTLLEYNADFHCFFLPCGIEHRSLLDVGENFKSYCLFELSVAEGESGYGLMVANGNKIAYEEILQEEHDALPEWLKDFIRAKTTYKGFESVDLQALLAPTPILASGGPQKFSIDVAAKKALDVPEYTPEKGLALRPGQAG